MAEMQDVALDWDVCEADPDDGQHGGWTLLPEGFYPFRVEKMERERYQGSQKMPQCPMAKLTLSEEEMQHRDPEWVAMRQEVNGHLTQEYRNRIQLLDDGSGAAQSIELLREAPEVVRQRKLRYVMEIETRI